MEKDFFGKEVLSCKKLPSQEAVVSANGGWFVIISVYTFLSLIMLVVGFAIWGGFIMILKKSGYPVKDIPIAYMIIWECLVLYFCISLARYGFKCAKTKYASFEMTLYEQGVIIINDKKTIKQKYQDITDIFSGRENARLIQTGAGELADSIMEGQMTIKFNDGSKEVIPMMLFDNATIENAIDYFMYKRPDLIEK